MIKIYCHPNIRDLTLFIWLMSYIFSTTKKYKKIFSLSIQCFYQNPISLHSVHLRTEDFCFFFWQSVYINCLAFFCIRDLPMVLQFIIDQFLLTRISEYVLYNFGYDPILIYFLACIILVLTIHSSFGWLCVLSTHSCHTGFEWGNTWFYSNIFLHFNIIRCFNIICEDFCAEVPESAISLVIFTKKQNQQTRSVFKSVYCY